MTPLDLRVVKPLDVLHVRGNRLFEGMGDGTAVMPPWPSLFAGAFRARMLTDAQAEQDYVAGTIQPPLSLALGENYQSRDKGSFRVAFACLIKGQEVLAPLPSDVIVYGDSGGQLRVRRLQPRNLPDGVGSSHAGSGLSQLPVVGERSKPAAGPWFLTAQGIARWQQGETPLASDLVHASELWQHDPRFGIARDRVRATVRTGLLYTARAVSLAPSVAFLVGIRGGHGCVPTGGLLRLGGDGRGATVSEPHGAFRDPPWQRVPRSDRFTVWLLSPGAFADGWRLPGCDATGIWRVGKLEARVVCATVPRHEVVSGWDLARRAPKPALRVVPPGAVYWLERISGSLEELESVLELGVGSADPSRRAEGFGAVWFGEW